MMKRLLIVLVVVFMAVSAYAYEPPDWCYPSSIQTGDAAVVSQAGFFYGMMVITDGTNAVTVKVYDNTEASGTKLIADWVVTTSSSNRCQTISIDPPVNFNNGCYVDVTTSGTVSYIVYYRTQ